MTNADKIRQMTNEELLEEIYKLMDNAAACPDCFHKTGKQRLRIYLDLKVKDKE